MILECGGPCLPRLSAGAAAFATDNQASDEPKRQSRCFFALLPCLLILWQAERDMDDRFQFDGHAILGRGPELPLRERSHGISV